MTGPLLFGLLAAAALQPAGAAAQAGGTLGVGAVVAREQPAEISVAVARGTVVLRGAEGAAVAAGGAPTRRVRSGDVEIEPGAARTLFLTLTY